MENGAFEAQMDLFKRQLRNKKMKTTEQRLAIHEAMLELGHASADMVCEKLAEKGCEVTVASVYNTLSQLAGLGIYQHRMSSNNKMYFDVNTFSHIHVYDTVNNKYKDLVDEDFTKLVESRLKKHRFRGLKIDGVDIQILCHPTSKKK